MYQVIIVGAGPAGAYLAYLLARKQIRTLLLDKKNFPRHKPCGGSITDKALKLLEFDIEQVVEDKINRFIVTNALKQPVTVTPGQSAAVCTVSRAKFDSYLVMKAKEAGAEVLEGTRADKVSTENGIAYVHAGEKVWPTKIIAGAEGVSSIVSRTFGLNRNVTHAMTLESHVPVSPEVMANYRGTIKADYGLVPAGYAWVFPKTEHVSVGVGSLTLKTKELRSFLHKLLSSEGFSPSSLQVHGWPIPLNPSFRSLHNGPALVVGDAAGLVDPFTGEGIYAALLSAKLAAQVICDQATQQNPNLREYTILAKKHIGKELLRAYRITRWFLPASGMFHKAIEQQPEFGTEFTRLFTGEINYANFIISCRKALGTTKIIRTLWSSHSKNSLGF